MTIMIARAHRFTMQLPLRYRLGARGAWNVGTTQNISHSGVRFVTNQQADPETPIDMRIEMNAALPLALGASSWLGHGPTRQTS